MKKRRKSLAAKTNSSSADENANLSPSSSLPLSSHSTLSCFLCLSEADVFISSHVQLQRGCVFVSRAWPRLVSVCVERIVYWCARACGVWFVRACTRRMAHQLDSLVELSENISTGSQHTHTPCPAHLLTQTHTNTCTRANTLFSRV